MQILAITLSVGLSWLFIFLGLRSLETRLYVLEQQYAALIDKEVIPGDKADQIDLPADSDPGDV